MLTIQSFSVLQVSKIEGIEPLAAKFLHIYSTIKKKPYEILDHRKLDFDYDYDDFKRQITDLEGSLQSFMTSCFDRTHSVIAALQLLER